MQALRLNEVLMRVVAWHNRHPLARRINPTQVHSIGEVLLPFASSMAAPAAGVGAPGLPTADELLDPPQAAARVGFSAEIDLHLDHPAAEARPFTLAQADQAALAAETAQTTGVGPGAPEPDLQADLSLPLDPPDAKNPVDHPAESAPDQSAAHPAGHASARAEAAGATDPAQARTSPFAAALAARSAATPAGKPAAPAGRLRRWLAQLPGRRSALPRLQAVFSRDFIWPISPRRVARWARRHGQLQPVAPADWPRREVETDSRMLAAARQKGLGQQVALHVLTAAVGVGDRRLRLLMAPDGHLIGPRAYSRPRLAAAGTLLALALLGAGWTRLRPAAEDAATTLAAAGAAAAAASAGSAASATLAAPAASASGPGSDPTLAVAPAAIAPTAEPAHAPGPDTPHSPAAPAAPAAPATPASPQHHQAAASTPSAPAAIPSAGATPAATAAASAAGNAAALVRIRPMLSDDDKQAARAQTAALRSGKPSADASSAQRLPIAPAAANATQAASPPTSPAPVYALVTAPNPQRELANTGLAAMRRASGRLTPPVPEHTELMQDQGRWRAAWWPFASLADAERARVLLAGKGIKAAVVEF